MKIERAKISPKGFVVVVVLSVVGLLAVLLLGFSYKARASLRAADNYQKSQQALNCARAGLNIAIAAIRSNAPLEKNSILDSRYSISSDERRASSIEALLSGETTFPFDDGSCSIVVTDESGKLNINLLIDKDDKPDRSKIDQLLRLIDTLNRSRTDQDNMSWVGYGIVPAILDWMDNNEQVVLLPFITRENLGAESDYYAGLEPPYKCANRPFNTIQELLLVKGVTPEVFERIRDYLTVGGDGKININTAPKPVIESLSENMDSALAQMIVERRKAKPYESIMELRDVPGMTDNIYSSIRDKVTLNPTDQYYLVKSCGNVGMLNRTVAAVLRKNTQAKTVDIVLYREI
jgi:general secretion pathway protein K